MSNVNNISNLQSSSTQALTRSTDKSAAAPTPHLKIQPASAPHRDQADLSPASVLLSQALSLPDVRADKVTKIQQALADGTYHVSSADLADKLITILQR